MNLKIQSTKIGIIGLSGSGKSTLLNDYLCKYTIELNHNIIPHNQIGYQRQKPILFDGFTVEENLKIPKNNNYQIALDLLNQFQCNYLLPQLDNLSGGEKQIVDFVRLMSNNYQIFLLDEPNSALDPSRSKILSDIIKQSDKSFIIVSHDISFLKQCCDQFMFIDQGKVLEFGPQILKTSKNPVLLQIISN